MLSRVIPVAPVHSLRHRRTVNHTAIRRPIPIEVFPTETLPRPREPRLIHNILILKQTTIPDTALERIIPTIPSLTRTEPRHRIIIHPRHHRATIRKHTTEIRRIPSPATHTRARRDIRAQNARLENHPTVDVAAEFVRVPDEVGDAGAGGAVLADVAGKVEEATVGAVVQALEGCGVPDEVGQAVAGGAVADGGVLCVGD